jgi:hypothetical protein
MPLETRLVDSDMSNLSHYLRQDEHPSLSKSSVGGRKGIWKQSQQQRWTVYILL